MPPTDFPLAETTETGELGIFHLKRLWSRLMAARRGRRPDGPAESQLDWLVIDAVGLGREQALQYLMRTGPSFAEFERWIVATTGGVEPEQVARINAAVTGADCPAATKQRLAAIDAMPPVLDAEDLAHWEEHGYVIVHDAVPEDSRAGAEQAVWAHLGARPDEPDSWYVPNDHGIMVQFFQHPAFTANRRSARVHKAFAQLWGTADLWPTTDRVGFNVPERPGWMFRGPDLHWDVSLHQPIPFGTQGILYLTDTPPEQGAFTAVPGFQRRIDSWLAGLPPGADPRQQDLHALGSRPIAGRAGDLVIWDQRLPHGSRPNRGTRPRIVQYINLNPARYAEQAVWR
jgi:hypothetical protein